jgi:hypothetical protein
MPARDIFHEAVRNALIKDGWLITNDPLSLTWDTKPLYVDLAAERLLAVEKPGRRIAIEVKSFLGPSHMRDFEQAVGQFFIYRIALAEAGLDRVLYLAVPEEVANDIFAGPMSQRFLKQHDIRLIVFSVIGEVIVEWRH